MCVLFIKSDESGQPDHAKSCIVVLGNLEHRQWGKHEQAAPVLKYSSLRLMVSSAVERHHKLKQADFKNAFCNPLLPTDELTIIRPPLGDPSARDGEYWLLNNLGLPSIQRCCQQLLPLCIFHFIMILKLTRMLYHLPPLNNTNSLPFLMLAGVANLEIHLPVNLNFSNSVLCLVTLPCALVDQLHGPPSVKSALVDLLVRQKYVLLMNVQRKFYPFAFAAMILALRMIQSQPPFTMTTEAVLTGVKLLLLLE